MAAGTLTGVLWAGLLRGVLLGMESFARAADSPHLHPRVLFLGRIPGTRRYSDTARHSDNEPIPDVVAFGVEAEIVYFNADHVFDTVLARNDSMPERPRVAVFDLSTSPNVDNAGAHMIRILEEELAKRGIEFRLAEAHSAVRHMLRVEGVDERFGGISRFTSLENAIDGSQRQVPSPALFLPLKGAATGSSGKTKVRYLDGTVRAH